MLVVLFADVKTRGYNENTQSGKQMLVVLFADVKSRGCNENTHSGK
jgi:hypothetical protein